MVKEKSNKRTWCSRDWNTALSYQINQDLRKLASFYYLEYSKSGGWAKKLHWKSSLNGLLIHKKHYICSNYGLEMNCKLESDAL